MKGVIAGKLGCQKVFDKIEALRIERDDLKAENQKRKDQLALMESNNKDLSAEVKTLTNRNQQQEEALKNLRAAIEKDAECFHEVRTELDSTKMIATTQAKELVAKDKTISELRQVNLSQEKILEGYESDIWQRGLHINRQYHVALNQFGAEPQPFLGTSLASKFFLVSRR